MPGASYPSDPKKKEMLTDIPPDQYLDYILNKERERQFYNSDEYKEFMRMQRAMEAAVPLEGYGEMADISGVPEEPQPKNAVTGSNPFRTPMKRMWRK